MYVLDKEAGTATLANPFTAQAEGGDPLVGDLYFVHRIDDMALCTEARIDGTLQLAQTRATTTAQARKPPRVTT